MTYPKGFLVAIGGAEDKGKLQDVKDTIVHFDKNGILKSLVDLICKHDTPKIAVITTASSYPDEEAKEYKAAFRKLHDLSIDVLEIQTREQADNEKNLSALEKVNCIFFTGGNQERLCSVLGGTKFFEVMRERYFNERFFIAGTSAGASAMSHTIITDGDPVEGYRKGKIHLSIGFELVSKIILDTHFDERGRLARLLQAIATQPGILGVGLGEDTGIIIEKGHILKVIGSAVVVIIQGDKLTYNNLPILEDNAPITLGNVILHTLTHSDKFDTETNTLYPVEFKEFDKHL
jgi:cyanophycinase